MIERLLLVDLENVQTVDLSRVPADVRVMVFYGITQKKLPEELVVQAQPLGERLKWIKISGQGPNALDFHIAFYVGQELAHRPKTECAILSRDTGFDPLIRHVQSMGHICRRASQFKDAFQMSPPLSQSGDYERLVALLMKEKARPVRRKGLVGKIKSWFPKLTDETRAQLLQRLIDESRVREYEKNFEYNF
jgi:PIN domain